MLVRLCECWVTFSREVCEKYILFLKSNNLRCVWGGGAGKMYSALGPIKYLYPNPILRHSNGTPFENSWMLRERRSGRNTWRRKGYHHHSSFRNWLEGYPHTVPCAKHKNKNFFSRISEDNQHYWYTARDACKVETRGEPIRIRT